MVVAKWTTQSFATLYGMGWRLINDSGGNNKTFVCALVIHMIPTIPQTAPLIHRDIERVFPRDSVVEHSTEGETIDF